MKTIEKMILCCIWICIAIVAVLIRDQISINERIMQARQQRQNVSVPQISDETLVIFNETEIMEMVAERMPSMNEALLEFRSDGIVEISLALDEELIEQAKNMIHHELVSAVLPVLKGTSIGCEASLSAERLELISCEAGIFSVPQELLEVAEEKLNETWSRIVESQKIETVQIDAGGLKLTVKEE